MKRFLIKDLENYSGIRRHTLRIWETRYDFLLPSRSAGNTRIYSLDQLELILDISVLVNAGSRIAGLAAMKKAELKSAVFRIQDQKLQKQTAVNDLIVSMYKLDTETFQDLLEQYLQRWPVDIVMTEIIYEFLCKTNLLWQGNRMTGEHFAVTFIKNKMILAIEKIRHPSSPAVKALLFLNGKGQFDLGLYYASYLLKAGGVRVIYMGHDISATNLMEAINSQQPDYLVTYFNKENKAFNFSGILQNCIHPATLVTLSSNLTEPDWVSSSPTLNMELDKAVSFICNTEPALKV